MASGADIRLFWPVAPVRIGAHLVAMGDPVVLGMLAVGGALAVARPRRGHAAAAATMLALAGLLCAKLVLQHRARGIYDVAAERAGGVVTRVTQDADWGSVTAWSVYDRTSEGLRAWHVDSFGGATLLFERGRGSADPRVDLSRAVPTVRHAIELFDLVFARVTALGHGGYEVGWSDIRFCRADGACDLWFGVQVTPRTVRRCSRWCGWAHSCRRGPCRVERQVRAGRGRAMSSTFPNTGPESSGTRSTVMPSAPIRVRHSASVRKANRCRQRPRTSAVMRFPIWTALKRQPASRSASRTKSAPPGRSARAAASSSKRCASGGDHVQHVHHHDHVGGPDCDGADVGLEDFRFRAERLARERGDSGPQLDANQVDPEPAAASREEASVRGAPLARGREAREQQPLPAADVDEAPVAGQVRAHQNPAIYAGSDLSLLRPNSQAVMLAGR